jgi:hypothetical protein
VKIVRIRKTVGRCRCPSPKLCAVLESGTYSRLSSLTLRYVRAMFEIIRLFFGTISGLFCSRSTLLLENLALRQQLVVFKRQRPRPRLSALDKLFWVAARRIWSERGSAESGSPERFAT